MIVKRVKTGITQLDSLIEGGFLEGSANMVTGETGTGKTIFALQFLWEGLKKGDTCIYITLEESPEDIKADALEFGWDFSEYESKGLFRIIYHDPAQVNNLGSILVDEIKTLNAKRLVIDSISVVGLSLQENSRVRKMVYSLINIVKRTGCTAVLTSEIDAGDENALSRYGVEEFVVDSVILLRYLEVGEESDRTLTIRKMRRTEHGKLNYAFQISDKGVILKEKSATSTIMR
jgi:KaiC/GvpD/RAD55 family RecA-like ATPase